MSVPSDSVTVSHCFRGSCKLQPFTRLLTQVATNAVRYIKVTTTQPLCIKGCGKYHIFETLAPVLLYEVRFPK